MAERLTFDWARIDDDDDAPAEIVPFHDVPVVERDVEGLDARLRDLLTRLWASPMVRNDPECRAIFESLLVERGADALDSAASRLGQRVDALIAARAAPARPPRMAAPPTPPRPASPFRSLFKL